MQLDVHQSLDVTRPFAVYGGGHWIRSMPEWEMGVALGYVIAAAGFTPVTGGYGGAMEAVSEGARRAGGEAVGVLYLPMEEARPNPYLTKHHLVGDYLERMAILLRVPHAFALSGRSGTLAELAAAAALLRRFEGRSLALWAPYWQSRVGKLFQGLEPATAEKLTWVSSLKEIKHFLADMGGDGPRLTKLSL